MARLRMVTRTVVSTLCKVMTVNVKTAQVSNKEVKLSGQYEGEKEMLAAIQKQYDTDEIKYVSVLECSVSEELYGMPESEFIKLAKILPPRKVYGEDSEG